MNEKHIDMMDNRIRKAPYGTAFIISDFTDIMDYETAKKSIARLEKGGAVRRVLRGVYDKPQYSTFLQEYSAPEPDKIAEAIARSNNWSIAPDGDTALNLLGLSTQIPATWQYYSSGPYKTYHLNHCDIAFVHRNNREIEGFSPKTALLIQAIKTIGQDKISDSDVKQMRSRFSAEDKQKILSEGQKTTRWIFELLKEICG